MKYFKPLFVAIGFFSFFYMLSALLFGLAN